MREHYNSQRECIKHTKWVALIYFYFMTGQFYYGDWPCLRIFTAEALFQNLQKSIYILKNEEGPHTILVDALYHTDP